ncbi:hypothetical protein L6164_003507 [Bauhinia variegata]|uniref:Uncharacterized protein n=1 Tax=Bauhinia variegata TaxID=167791 RepID=A0ACB9Q250_BAUVA|nr:hypothetical protein L6164_003507 [Bauhinia variegata]
MNFLLSIGSERNWYKYFEFNEQTDNRTDIRNILLVVFTLIAAVTFQAGVNPPGGVWQDGNGNQYHIPGTAIYASQTKYYYVFLIANTLAFSYAIFVILSLTHKFPFHFELWIATMSMATTYVSAIFAVTPREAVKFRFILITAFVPFIVRFGIHCFRVCYKKIVE